MFLFIVLPAVALVIVLPFVMTHITLDRAFDGMKHILPLMFFTIKSVERKVDEKKEESKEKEEFNYFEKEAA